MLGIAGLDRHCTANALGFGKAHRFEHKSHQTTTTACDEGSENVRIISAIATRIDMEPRAMSG